MISKKYFAELKKYLLLQPKLCESSSVGRARPCQGRGRGFEPRLSLQEKDLSFREAFF